MKKRRGELCCVNGRYRRTIGKFMNENNKVAPKKFILGTDARRAEVANLKLEQLWEVVQQHFRQREQARPFGVPAHAPGEPLWEGLYLRLAEAVRTGQTSIPLGADVDDEALHTDAAYATKLHWLNQSFGHIMPFVPLLPDSLARGQDEHARWATHHIRQATRNSEIARMPLPTAAGATVWQALDAYATHACERNAKEFGKREAEAAGRLKDSHPDVPLDQFGYSGLERIARYWSSRPRARRTGKPIALATVTGMLKTAKRFVRWLDRSDAFEWEMPRHAADALRADVDRLRTDDEIAALKDGVPTYSIAELGTLLSHATDVERALILLALNTGSAHAELCSLRRDELVDPDGVATVKRIRRKNHVYGEFVLWPETRMAMAWLTHQRPGTHKLVLMTDRGAPYDRQRIANTWNRLLERIRADHPSFRGLPFKYLRKTAGQLVRNRSNGEVAGVFLCHGRAVKSDDLADVYTNRPFGQVAQALAAVRQDLQPAFAAIPTNAFTEQRVAGGPNISRGTIARIQQLWRVGTKPADIARATRVSRSTVYRWRPATEKSGPAIGDRSHDL